VAERPMYSSYPPEDENPAGSRARFLTEYLHPTKTTLKPPADYEPWRDEKAAARRPRWERNREGKEQEAGEAFFPEGKWRNGDAQPRGEGRATGLPDGGDAEGMKRRDPGSREGREH